MKRPFVLAALASVTLLLLAPAAHAKGAQEVSISGPHLTVIDIQGERQTGEFSTMSGFWPQAFETIPDPTTKHSSATVLGPVYVARYFMAAPGMRKTTVIQDIYPYALGGPQTFVKAGQPALGGHTHGGWFAAGDDLLSYLQSHGLPSAHALGVAVQKKGNDAATSQVPTSPPATPRSVTGSAVPPSGNDPWWPWALGVAGVSLIVAGVVARLRRVRTARTVVT